MKFGIRDAGQTSQCFVDEILRLWFLFRTHRRHPCLAVLPRNTTNTSASSSLNYKITVSWTLPSVFRVPEISLLGYKISSMGSQPLPVRITDLQAYPLPRPTFLGNVKFLSALPPTRSHAPSPSSRRPFPSCHLERRTRRNLQRVQREPVWSCSPVPSTSNRSTRLGHERFNHRHACRPPTACARRLAAPRLLLQETEPGTAKIQCLRQGALGNLRGGEVLPSHAGGPAFHHPDGPQNAKLRNWQYL